MKDPATEKAEFTARLKAFNKSLPTVTDEELFETLRSIQRERLDARSGFGAGKSEELVRKERHLEEEISRRHPDETLRIYENWLKTRT